ncbi:hypothetical protein AGMMS50229_01250 [Campylobacterota bacterium]|nr:hypothetical protein AGMMS50229_01250 [Campylobacterota bacterium]
MPVQENTAPSNSFWERFNAENISNWAWSNAPAIIGVAVAAAIGSIVGLIAGLALFAFINYYKQTSR